MKELFSITLDELDLLDREYAQKNKRNNGNLRNLIGDHEKIIFCYHQLASIPNRSGFGAKLDILFYILTDIKLIFTSYASNPVYLMKINDITNVMINTPGFLRSGSMWIGYGNGKTPFIEDFNDTDFLQGISDAIKKAKANLDVRSHSATININTPKISSQESIAEQLVKLADLHKSGVLTDDEFKRAKERVLSKDS